MKVIKILFIVSVVFGSSRGVQAQAENPKPNIVIILSDQQSYDDLGCYGNAQVKTPNLDKFAKTGVKLKRNFSNSPICTPFRGLMMSGKFSVTNGAFTNDVPMLPDGDRKLAEVLGDYGYNTAYIGKWHLYGGNRDRPIPKGEMRYGFNQTFLTDNCTTLFDAGKAYYWNDAGKKMVFDKWQPYGQSDQAIEYLEEAKKKNQPFAMVVAFHPPHDHGKIKGEDGKLHYNYSAPKELMALYNADTIKVRPGIKSTADLRKMYQGHYAMISGVDKAFGSIVDKLKELGLSENTIVIFTSDHGDLLEQYGATEPKQHPQDYSSRTPFLISWPDHLKAGTESGLMFSAIDIMPTLLGLINLKTPIKFDGKNLANALLNNNEDEVKYVPYWCIPKNTRGVITQDYTFSVEKESTERSLNNVLYDRNKDPYQLNNLFNNPEMKAVQINLHNLTLSWMKDMGDEFYSAKEARNSISSRIPKDYTP